MFVLVFYSQHKHRWQSASFSNIPLSASSLPWPSEAKGEKKKGDYLRTENSEETAISF